MALFEAHDLFLHIYIYVVMIYYIYMVIYASQIPVCILHQFSYHVEPFSQHMFWDPSGVPDIHVHPPRRGNNQV